MSWHDHDPTRNAEVIGGEYFKTEEENDKMTVDFDSDICPIFFEDANEAAVTINVL